MADQQRFHPLLPPDLKALYVDNGDGTYSLKVATAAASAGPIATAAKGSTLSGSPTSTDVDANRQALDVYVRSPGAPATIADGADVAQGTTTDLSSASTVIGLLKNIKAALAGTLTVATHAVTGSGNFATTVADGANVTQGAAADANTANTVMGRLTKIRDLLAATLTVTGAGGTFPVTGTFWQATQPVSSAAASQVDGHSANIGALADASSASTLTGLLKNIKAALAGALTVANSTTSTAATVNSGTANGAVLSVALAGAGSLVLMAAADAGTQTTAFTGSFQVSADGGTTWQSILAARTDAINSGPAVNMVSAASQQRSFIFDTAGWTNFRVNQTVQIVGTGIITFTAVTDTMAHQALVRDLNIATAAAAADALANPTAGILQAAGLVFNGTTWDRMQSAAKNVQPTKGYLPTQDAKDAGRSSRVLILDDFLTTQVAEVIMTMDYSTDNGAHTTGTSYTVTAGKQFRLQSIALSGYGAGTAPANQCTIVVRIRINQSGAGIVTSPVEHILAVDVPAALSASNSITLAIPDGYEIPAGAGIAVTILTRGWVVTTTTPRVFLSITGYEY